MEERRLVAARIEKGEERNSNSTLCTYTFDLPFSEERSSSKRAGLICDCRKTRPSQDPFSAVQLADAGELSTDIISPSELSEDLLSREIERKNAN